MPEPAILVDAEARVDPANAPARDLLPALAARRIAGAGAARARRASTPSRRVAASGEAETALWSERAPIERLFQVDVAPLATDAGRRRRHAADPARSDRSAPRRAHARRFHRQRQPRIAHPARLAARLRRDAARLGAATTPRRATKFLDIMRDQGRRMARLIDDLLSLSRIEQKQHLRPDAAGRSRADRRAMSPIRWPRWRANWASSSGSTPRTPVIVIGERDELVRVAENLIENAIKYGARAEGASGRRSRSRSAQGQGRRRCRARLRPRHRARTSAAPDRTLLPRRSPARAAPRTAPASASPSSSTSSPATAAG